jgi:hypothetical protein
MWLSYKTVEWQGIDDAPGREVRRYHVKLRFQVAIFDHSCVVWVGNPVENPDLPLVD